MLECEPTYAQSCQKTCCSPVHGTYFERDVFCTDDALACAASLARARAGSGNGEAVRLAVPIHYLQNGPVSHRQHDVIWDCAVRQQSRDSEAHVLRHGKHCACGDQNFCQADAVREAIDGRGAGAGQSTFGLYP